ncbi:uncharacterized protein LOC143597549 [Bidens hawaiensis]|uniref:uncharacterized protein LOC143597549 n=1 Tax=Bidens hawaiensis TaxID=980011 RepID=UPI004049CF2B
MEDEPGNNNGADLNEDFDSACSTPFVSAPSSPGRGGGFFYSAPASPIHFMLSSSSSYLDSSNASAPVEGGFEFDFTAKRAAVPIGSMTSADELFLNGQIRPMKLSSHLQRPQVLAPLLDENDLENDDDDENENTLSSRGRDSKMSSRSKSLRRRARSMSPPLRTADAFQWLDEGEPVEIICDKSEDDQVKPSDGEGESCRSSSVGRSSKRWVFLKVFLYRSKSEGRSAGNHKFWTSLSFSPNSNSKEKKSTAVVEAVKRKPVNGVGMKPRVARSAHELHYTTNRAQAEELRRKTYLPYKQGLLGCLGFSSKSYGAMNGFARALNPVSSR